MSQLVVTRALKKLPPFNIFENKGEVKNILLRTGIVVNQTKSDLTISPYSEMIPAIYLYQKYEERHRNIAGIVNATRAARLEARVARKIVNDYLFYNQAVEVQFGYRRRTNLDVLKHSFTIGNYYPDTFRTGPNSYTISQYSVFMSVPELMNGLVPSILLVIPRENYVYCKMKLIKTGVLDLSMCVLLIDQKLDTTDYAYPQFRTIYRQLLVPEMAKLNITIAKVPLSYMMEKCFVPKFQFTSENIFDRKKEEEEIKKELLTTANKYLGVEEVNPPSSPELTTDNEITNLHGEYSLGIDPYRLSGTSTGAFITTTDNTSDYTYVMNMNSPRSSEALLMAQDIQSYQEALGREVGIPADREGERVVASYTGVIDPDDSPW